MLDLRRTVKSMVREMCGEQLKDRKRSKDLMLGLNKTIDQLLRREDGCVLKRALDFEVEIRRKKLSLRGLGRRGLRNKL